MKPTKQQQQQQVSSKNYSKPRGGRKASDLPSSQVISHKMSGFQQKKLCHSNTHTHTHTESMIYAHNKEEKKAVNRNCA